MFHFHHVENRDSLGDADDELDAGCRGFEDSVGGKLGRHIADADVGAGRFARLLDGVENGNAFEVGAALAGHHARDHLRSVFAACARVQLAGGAGDSLGEDAAVLVDENAHRETPIAWVTRRAASAMSLAAITLIPDSARIFLPSTTLVPSILTTSGTLSLTCWAASTTPWASTSQRMMPPKMLISTALTRGSPSRMRNAAATFSVLAPPPTSRKFAGSAP